MFDTRAALMAAIRAAPDDDAPRLAAADWFEEQGGEANAARAEFIRLQIRRANLPADDPRHSELYAREMRLLKRHAPTWCGSHFVFKKVLFRRGFIDYVHLHLQHFLHHRRQMLALEPVTDIRLTGWFRAKDDLVRRVAACEEWKGCRTLRIHHQGPHNDPRSNLLELLESPHLTGLRSLHGTRVHFDLNARRRFERLPCLRRVRELVFPTLDMLLEKPGEWFSDDGASAADHWDRLRSLVLPRFLNIGRLGRFMARRWWDRLESLSLHLPRESREALAILRACWPSGLRQLSLYSPGGSPNLRDNSTFRDTPADLRGLHLSGFSITPADLRNLLGGKGQTALRELTLSRCRLTTDHLRVLAETPGAKTLRSLNISGNREVNDEGVSILLSSERLRALVHLDLSQTSVGVNGLAMLGEAPGWDRLRVLDLSGTRLTEVALRKLMESLALQALNRLFLGSRELSISSTLAADITRLPHLVRLHLNVPHCDPRTRQVLEESASLAWALIEADDEEGSDVQKHRALNAPERCPPVEDQPRFVAMENKNGGAPV